MAAQKPRLKVLKKFRDKKEKVIREPGDEFEVTKTRMGEIEKALPGFVELIPEEPTPEK